MTVGEVFATVEDADWTLKGYGKLTVKDHMDYGNGDFNGDCSVFAEIFS